MAAVLYFCSLTSSHLLLLLFFPLSIPTAKKTYGPWSYSEFGRLSSRDEARSEVVHQIQTVPSSTQCHVWCFEQLIDERAGRGGGRGDSVEREATTPTPRSVTNSATTTQEPDRNQQHQPSRGASIQLTFASRITNSNNVGCHTIHPPAEVDTRVEGR